MKKENGRTGRTGRTPRTPGNAEIMQSERSKPEKDALYTCPCCGWLLTNNGFEPGLKNEVIL